MLFLQCHSPAHVDTHRPADVLLQPAVGTDASLLDTHIGVVGSDGNLMAVYYSERLLGTFSLYIMNFGRGIGVFVEVTGACRVVEGFNKGQKGKDEDEEKKVCQNLGEALISEASCRRALCM